MARSYRALIRRGSSSEDGAPLHLIGDDAEASLCGIPRSSLVSGGVFDEVMCDECIEWLRRRNTGNFRKAPRGTPAAS